MMTIAIANQKGGCGKTTTAINLAACLGQQQLRILLIDMDPQGHASLGLGLQCDDRPGLYEVLMCETEINNVIIADICSGVDIVPATISLAAAEQLLANFKKKDLQLMLHLEDLHDHYDYIIIDCPPQLGLLSFNALRAADQLIIPLEMSLYALDGVARLIDTIDLLRQRFDTDIPICILPTMVDYRTRFTNKILDEIKERFSNHMIASPIHYTVRIKEAAYHGKAIIDFEARSPAANDYMLLCDDIMNINNPAREVLSETQQRFSALNKTAAPAPVKPIIDAVAGTLNSSTKDDVLKADDTLPHTQVVTMQFTDNGIHHLQIAGEFNNWVPDKNIRTEHCNGHIKKMIQLQPGLYQYRLIINGEWQQDPNNPEQALNNYGVINSLLRVTAPEEATL